MMTIKDTIKVFSSSFQGSLFAITLKALNMTVIPISVLSKKVTFHDRYHFSVDINNFYRKHLVTKHIN